jgi:hypothetical protein
MIRSAREAAGQGARGRGERTGGTEGVTVYIYIYIYIYDISLARPLL